MSSTLEKLVQATVSSLGYLDRGVYYPEPDCLIGIHDLIRFLHNDKETLDARRICLVNNIVRNDLVPLMGANHADEKIFDSALRLAANLCQPTIVAFGGKMPESSDILQVYRDVEKNLVNSLSAFTNSKVFEKFADIMKSFFSKDWADRDESEKTTIDRIVLLVRYILAIGMECPVTAEVPKVDPFVKERVIRAFLGSELPGVLMTVGCDRMEKELTVHIMAIFSLMLRSIDCERVATVEILQTPGEVQRQEDELREMVERDKILLNARRFKFAARPNLGASYLLKNSALDPDRDLLVQNNTHTPLDSLRSRKRTHQSTKRTRVRNVMESVFKPNADAPLDVCRLINAFCKEFIVRAFDKLMKATREMAFTVNRQGGVLAYSDVNYFFLAEYVFQFIRRGMMEIEKVSSVFSREFFHHIISQCDNYFELMKTDKFNITSYAVRAQHAISAYKEMMLLLNSLATSERCMDKEVFAYMTRTIYYNEEYREFGYLTLNKLGPQGMTRKLLEDLIVASHYYIGTMDYIIKTGQLRIVARRKRIMKKRKKEGKQIAKVMKEHQNRDKMKGDDLDGLWNELKSEVEDVLGGRIQANDDISPINILLKVEDEKHQIFAVLQIQRALRGRRVTDALGTYKAARDLWPDSTFGADSNTVEQDMTLLREICTMELADIGTEYDGLMKDVYGIDANAADTTVDDEEHISVSDNERKKREEEGNELDEESDEDKPKFKIAEINLNFNDYIAHFTKPDVIKWYIFVLKDFDSNSKDLNRAILKMFHRIAFQMGTPSHLYSASLFEIFRRVDAEIQKLPRETAKKHQFYDIYKLGYHLLQKFFAHFKERGPVLICELLFSKSRAECLDIEQGYGTHEEQQKDVTVLWTETLEEELEKLYHQYQTMEEKPEGISIYDYIQHNLSKERYPKQIRRQLKRMGLQVEKLKRERKTKRGESSKLRKSKRIIDGEELFASRSPTRSSSSGESETGSSNVGGDDENEEDMGDSALPELLKPLEPLDSLEERLQREEAIYLSKTENREVIIAIRQEEEVTTIEEQTEFVETFQSNSPGNEEDSVQRSKKSIKKQKSPRRSHKYRSLLKQPAPPEFENNDAIEEQDENAIPNSQPQTQHSFLRQAVVSDSDEDDDVVTFEEDGEKPSPGRRFIGSDDESEEMSLSQKKRQMIFDDEDENSNLSGGSNGSV